MFRQCMLSFLLLGSLVPSLQAELAEQPDVDLEDKCLAAVAGFCGAYVTAFGIEMFFRCATRSRTYDFLSLLGTTTFYGYFSRKLSKKDNQLMKMYGRGGLVGTCGLLRQIYLHMGYIRS